VPYYSDPEAFLQDKNIELVHQDIFSNV
jgi:hypothetical protein